MRVLTIGNLYPPHHFGGYEQAWQSANRHLRDRGDDVHVLATDYRHPGVEDGDEPDVSRDLQWYWRDHDFVRFSRRERLHVERTNHARLTEALDRLDPDVVAFWSMGGMSHSLIEAVRRRGLPMAAFVLDEWLGYGRAFDQWTRQFSGRGRLLAPLAERLTGTPATVDHEAAGRYVFASEFLRRRAAEAGLDLPDTAIAPCGIRADMLDPAAADRDPEWRGRLLYVGRLHPDKGIEDAVRALALLPDATLSFAGSWDRRDEAALDAQIADAGVADRVTMLGHVPNDRVAVLYRDHDALLFPVRWEEPWGMVPLEAMAAGCPVIATGRGGSGEYLRNLENCLLVSTHQPAELARLITVLAGDAGLRARLRRGGVETAPRHTDAIYNAEVARHLDEVAA